MLAGVSSHLFGHDVCGKLRKALARAGSVALVARTLARSLITDDSVTLCAAIELTVSGNDSVCITLQTTLCSTESHSTPPEAALPSSYERQCEQCFS